MCLFLMPILLCKTLKTNYAIFARGVEVLKKVFQIASIVMLLFFAGATFAFPLAHALSLSFGNVGIGDSNKTTFGGMFVSNFTSPSDLGNITQINAYLATGGTLAQGVIYSDKNGAPDVLLAQSSDVDMEGTSGRWVRFDVSYHGDPNTTYWLGVLLSSAGTYYFSSNVNGRVTYSSTAIEASNTFPDGAANPNEYLSAYAVYTPFSSPPQSSNQSWIEPLLIVVAIVGLIIAATVGVIVYAKRRRR